MYYLEKCYFCSWKNNSLRMRRYILTIMAAMMASVVAAQVATRTVRVEVRNDNDFDKVAEPVAIKLKDVKKLNFSVRGASVREGGKVVQSQLDDMDGDFEYDELFFVTDIKAHESKVFDVNLSATNDESNKFVALKGDENKIYTALQFRDKKDKYPDLLRVEAKGSTNLFNDIYMHGMTIESELTGYRIYFDERQNIDLYGKRYRRIELPETQFYTTAEQLKAGYGVDVLWAGKAIGCGSFKQYDGKQPQNWTNVGLRGQRVVTTGPLRTIVEMYDLAMERPSANGAERYDVRQMYTLVAGHRDLTVDVTFRNVGDMKFCTGVQKVGVTADDSVRRGHKSEGMIREDGIAMSWGCDYPDMGKKQIWAPEAIGMAVYVPTKYIKGRNEDELNYVYVVAPDASQTLRYYVTFCADKEEQGYHSANEWFTSLDAWKKNVEKTVKIRVLK